MKTNDIAIFIHPKITLPESWLEAYRSNYLNDGIGYDWAGQIRALEAPSCVLAKVNSSLVSTLGATEPTGSIKNFG